MTRATPLVLVMAVLLHAAGAAAQSPRPDESSPRITVLEAWLSAVDRHRPGAFDLSVGLVSGLNQEQLRLIWTSAPSIGIPSSSRRGFGWGGYSASGDVMTRRSSS